MQPNVQMSESVRRVFSAYCAAASVAWRWHPHAGKKRIGRKAQRVRRGDVPLRNLSEQSCRGRLSPSIETLAVARRTLAACKEKGAETNGTQGSAGQHQIATCLTAANEGQVRKCPREIERHSLLGQRFKAQQTCFLPPLRGGAAHGREVRRCSASQRHAAADRWPTLRGASLQSRDRVPEP